MKRYQRALCVGLTVFLLAACGKTLELNPKETVDQLQKDLTFTDEMAELDKDNACRIYGVEETLVDDCAGLRGSGATAENLSVWKADSADDAEEIKAQLQSFLESWTEGYADYKPEEVPKLESAVLSSAENYVILCVSADNDTAETLINGILHP